VEQLSELIAGVFTAKTKLGANDRDSHEAIRAFLEGGFVDAEDLLAIASAALIKSPFFMIPGGDRIIRYLCGLKD
jgi:hypothetical protein